MSRLSSLIARLPAVDSRSISDVEQEIRQELEFHLAMRAEEFARHGMTADDAHAAAKAQFGDFNRVYHSCRRALLGDRIMFQRLQTATIAVLLLAVVALAYHSYSTQRANQLAIDKLNARLAALPSTRATERGAQPPAWEADRPRVIDTFPVAGSTDVDPTTNEIRVTYNAAMADGCWSWVQSSPESFPKTTGDVHYLEDMKTCIMPVELQPDTKYVVWLNSANHQNFKDREGRPAVPHLLVFQTRK